MTGAAALQRLVTWLSPAFPVGAFAWSAGLETAIAERAVTDSAGLQNWIEGALAHGAIRTDAILLAEAHRRFDSQPALQELADLALALIGSAERLRETTITADSYVQAVRFWPLATIPRLPDPCPYPVAVGALAAAHGIELGDTLIAWLTATVQGQISVAVRLVPLGQSDGLRVLAALEAPVAALAAAATAASLADIGAIAYAADIAQLRHETLEPRIFPLMTMIVAAVIFVILLAVAIAHLLWAIGSPWPIRDPELLARTVVGRPGITRVPKGSALLRGAFALAAGIFALALADHTGGGLGLTLTGIVLAALFIGRGLLGYTAGWRARFPVEPYASLDRRNYSPLFLLVGGGFVILLFMRLI